MKMDKNEDFVLASSMLEEKSTNAKERKNATVKACSFAQQIYHETYY